MQTRASEPFNSCYARNALMEEACIIFAASAQNGVTPTEFTFANVVI
jgi:hypothetical protein